MGRDSIVRREEAPVVEEGVAAAQEVRRTPALHLTMIQVVGEGEQVDGEHSFVSLPVVRTVTSRIDAIVFQVRPRAIQVCVAICLWLRSSAFF